MTRNARPQRRHDMASILHPTAENDSSDRYPPTDSDNPNGNTAHSPRGQEMETPAPPQSWVSVQGEQMLLPQTYDPDTYDSDGRMPWTPEPELSSPKTYAEWGRKHFGEEWHKTRKTMLEERNIYLGYDEVYKQRQRALRVIEHKIERRPFRPGQRAGGIRDPGWKRWWARLSEELDIPVKPPSPTSSRNSDDGEADLSGDDTYHPNPSPREPTPTPENAWVRLEYNRQLFNWDEERYHYERAFLKEALIDGARSLREDADGDRQAHEKREAMESFRDVDPIRYSIENNRFQAHIDLPKMGWTPEQINAEHDADIAVHEWRQNNPEPGGSESDNTVATPEDRAALHDWKQKLNAAKIRIYGELPPRKLGAGSIQSPRKIAVQWQFGARVSTLASRRRIEGVTLPKLTRPKCLAITQGQHPAAAPGSARHTRRSAQAEESRVSCLSMGCCWDEMK